MGNNDKHYKLWKSQRAELGQVITEAGLNVNDFVWSEDKSNFVENLYVPVIERSSFPFNFTFDRYQNRWAMRYSPGDYTDSGQETTSSWDVARQTFRQWIMLLKREEEAEDPWSSDEAENFEQTWKSSNEKFTLEQLKDLEVGLDAVQNFLIEQAGQNETAIKEIQSGIIELKEAAKRSGRRDWLMLFVGWFVTHAADWSVGSIHWHELIKVLLKGSKTLLIGP